MNMLYLDADGIILSIRGVSDPAPPEFTTRMQVPDASRYSVGQNLYAPGTSQAVPVATPPADQRPNPIPVVPGPDPEHAPVLPPPVPSEGAAAGGEGREAAHPPGDANG
jgi:hypothetical protein